MKKRLLSLIAVITLFVSACSFMNNGQTIEATHTEENTEESKDDKDDKDEIEALKAEIEDLKAEIAEKNEAFGDSTEAAEESEKREELRDDEEDEVNKDYKEKEESTDESESNEADLDAMADKFKRTIDVEPRTFDSSIVGYRLVDLTDDSYPELLYIDNNGGLKGIGMYTGDKVKLCEGLQNLLGLSHFGGSIKVSVPNENELVFYYGERSGRFAIYQRKLVYQDQDVWEDDNYFYEIDQRGDIQELYETKKHEGQGEDPGFFTQDALWQASYEQYEEMNDRFYDGLEKKVDLKNDCYYTFDEAFDAYMNEK